MIQCNCPSCGSAVRFKSELSVYATCGACNALLVRQDVNVEMIGKVAELQPDGTPLQLGTQGRYNGVQFELVGRIQIRHEAGFWNEWCLHYQDRKVGWLGEAAGEYFLSFDQKADGLPAYSQLALGQVLRLEGEAYAVTNLMTSKVVSYEGELPFIMPGEYALPSADLRSCSGKAATIDYSEESPILFMGEYVPFEQLEFRGLREASTEADDMAGPTLHFGAVKKFNCTSCGAPLEIKGGPRSQVIVCEYCDAAIDARDPNMAILWKAEQQRAHKVPPSIPLGSKAMLEEAEWECIGFMRRSVTYEGVAYPWSEYLLHNRYKGYRWLTESDGHFTLMDALKKLPEQGNAPVSFPTQSDIQWDGRPFRHFQSSQGRVDYVAGEFYWRVALGDPTVNHDYIAPPDILSMEVSENGIDWSHGVYVTGQDVWEGFGLEGRPPRTSGVAPNQPNPLTDKRVAVWRLFKLLVVLAFLITGFQWFTSMNQKPLYNKSFDHMSYEQEPSKVSEPFEVKGPTSNLAIDIAANNLSNRWAYFNMSLVNQKTKKRYVFGKNLSYYYSRGDRQGRILLSSIPPGTYVLNWDIQTAGAGGKKDENKPPAAGAKPTRQFSYTLKVTRGVPQWGWVLTLIFLLIWSPLITTARYNSFETRRWSQSDHA